jgi:hypothetical protein
MREMKNNPDAAVFTQSRCQQTAPRKKTEIIVKFRTSPVFIPGPLFATARNFYAIRIDPVK